MMMMSMGRDCLRSEAINGPIVHPSGDMSMETHGGMLLTRKTYSPSCRLVANQKELGEGNNEFSLQIIFLHTSKWFLYAVKSCDIGPTDLLPLRSKACCAFLSPLKTHHSAGYEPANLGSNGKHANHYRTVGTTPILRIRSANQYNAMLVLFGGN
jgi:hypothetical protein